MYSSPRWLTTLIELRQHHRTECRRRLDEAERARAVLAEKVRSLESEAGEVVQLRRQTAGVAGVDIARLLAAQRHQAALLMEHNTIRQQTDLLDQEIERRRAALIEAERQVRTLEKLVERRAQEARLRADRQETKRLDELACIMSPQRLASGERKAGYSK